MKWRDWSTTTCSILMAGLDTPFLRSTRTILPACARTWGGRRVRAGAGQSVGMTGIRTAHAPGECKHRERLAGQLQVRGWRHTGTHWYRLWWEPVARREPPRSDCGGRGRSSRGCRERGSGRRRLRVFAIGCSHAHLELWYNLTLACRTCFTGQGTAQTVYRTEKRGPRAFQNCVDHRQTPRRWLGAKNGARARGERRAIQISAAGKGLTDNACHV